MTTTTTARFKIGDAVIASVTMADPMGVGSDIYTEITFPIVATILDIADGEAFISEAGNGGAEGWIALDELTAHGA